MGILKAQFCENLRLERQKRKWSQENVADMLKMSHSGYAKIERGDTDVSLEKIEEIASTFEISVFELLKVNQTSQNVFHFNHNKVNTLQHNQMNAVQQLNNMDSSVVNERFQQIEQEIGHLKLMMTTLIEKINRQIELK